MVSGVIIGNKRLYCVSWNVGYEDEKDIYFISDKNKWKTEDRDRAIDEYVAEANQDFAKFHNGTIYYSKEGIKRIKEEAIVTLGVIWGINQIEEEG